MGKHYSNIFEIKESFATNFVAKWRKEYAFLVCQTEIERPQKSYLPYYDRISQFKRDIFDGPYFIYIICNRCLYRRSFFIFKVGKYSVSREALFAESLSFVGKMLFEKRVI